MISQTNQEMLSMSIPADAAQTTMMDSVRRNLVYLPDMTSRDLTQFCPTVCNDGVLIAGSISDRLRRSPRC